MKKPITKALDDRRMAIALATPQQHKSALGQFFTPDRIAHFMASMFSPLAAQDIYLLDAGAGIGSLTAAFAHRAAQERASSLACEAWEIDAQLKPVLTETLQACVHQIIQAGGTGSWTLLQEDFILSFSNLFSPHAARPATHAILNPPYKKISSMSAHRTALSDCGVEVSNLYAAFVSLALLNLKDGGELVAITPRSFCNGTYFRPFRELILSKAAITHLHVFESRTDAFGSDEVLQENVIFHLVKGAPQGKVMLTSCQDASFAALRNREVDFDEVVLRDDAEKIFHIATEKHSLSEQIAMQRYRYTLGDIGLSVSTGPVVDFRMREHLRTEPDAAHAPLVYSHHFSKGFVQHPHREHKKPDYIAVNEETRKWLMPNGFYVVIRRLSSKEEIRRIVPAVFEPIAAADQVIGFDNKTNFFHLQKRGLSAQLAKGLAVYLSSTFVDQWLRRFSGHTQVNAGDLRALRYPDVATLMAWGSQITTYIPEQTEIDRWVGGVNVED